MEASGADGTVQEAQPNGLVLVCGQFDPLAVVELVDRRAGEFRSENDREVLNRRTVDEDGLVGFSGLEVGGAYFVRGYTGGRYFEVRAVAQDPALAITGFQTPPAPPKLLVGTAGAPAVAVVPEPPETPTEGKGLTDEAKAALEQGAADEQAAVDPSPADDQSASNSEPGAGDGAAEAEAEVPDPAAGLVPSSQAADTEPAAGDPPTPAATSSQPAPVAVDSALSADVAPAQVPAAVDQQEANAEKVAAAPDAATVEASQEPDEPTDWEKLVNQAGEVGVENASTLSDAELRQAITEKHTTPVV